jgi:hypothetical protein
MKKRPAVFSIAMTIALASTAHAANVSVTPPLLAGTAASANCCVANLQSETVTPLVEIVSFAGAISVTASPAISANGINCVTDETPTASTCRVSNVSPKKIRVTYCMADGSDNCMATVVAPTK